MLVTGHSVSTSEKILQYNTVFPFSATTSQRQIFLLQYIYLTTAVTLPMRFYPKKHIIQTKMRTLSIFWCLCCYINECRISASSLNEPFVHKVFLNVSHSYIKEFVHGDFGRTKPNMCELLQTDTDILELDVEVRASRATAGDYHPAQRRLKLPIYMKNSDILWD